MTAIERIKEMQKGIGCDSTDILKGFESGVASCLKILKEEAEKEKNRQAYRVSIKKELEGAKNEIIYLKSQLKRSRKKARKYKSEYWDNNAHNYK